MGPGAQASSLLYHPVLPFGINPGYVRGMANFFLAPAQIGLASFEGAVQRMEAIGLERAVGREWVCSMDLGKDAIVEMCRIAGDTNVAHRDPSYVGRLGYIFAGNELAQKKIAQGEEVISPGILCGLLADSALADLPGKTLQRSIKFRGPVFSGDNVVLNLRGVSYDPSCDVLNIEGVATNGEGQVVMELAYHRGIKRVPIALEPESGQVLLGRNKGIADIAQGMYAERDVVVSRDTSEGLRRVLGLIGQNPSNAPSIRTETVNAGIYSAILANSFPGVVLYASSSQQIGSELSEGHVSSIAVVREAVAKNGFVRVTVDGRTIQEGRVVASTEERIVLCGLPPSSQSQ